MTDPKAPDTPDDDIVIDLRDDAPFRVASGRPAGLLPGHHLLTITTDDTEMWDRAERFVYDIYREVGYCEASERGWVEELARWTDRSTFHAVIDDVEGIIGTVRVICGQYDDLPVGKFQRTADPLRDPVCELSSLTVRNDVRSTGVIEHLYRAAWLDSFRTGSSAVVALIDDWLLDVFTGTYHLPFAVVGEAEDYMGGRPLPVAMPLTGSAYDELAASNPDFWRWTLEAVSPEEAERWGLTTELGDGTVATPGQVEAVPQRS